MTGAFSVAPQTSDQTLRTLLRAYEPQCGGEGNMRKVMASKSSAISVRPVIRPERSIFATWPWMTAPSYLLGSITLAVNLSPSQLVSVVSPVSSRILSKAPSGTSARVFLRSLSL